MLAAKKRYIEMKNILKVLIITICCSCSSLDKELLPTNNKGGYRVIQIKKAKPKDKVLVDGVVLDIISKKPIIGAIVKIGCFESVTDSKGEYSFYLNPQIEEKMFLKVITIGYRSIETDFFNFKKKQFKI